MFVYGMGLHVGPCSKGNLAKQKETSKRAAQNYQGSLKQKMSCAKSRFFQKFKQGTIPKPVIDKPEEPPDPSLGFLGTAKNSTFCWNRVECPYFSEDAKHHFAKMFHEYISKVYFLVIVTLNMLSVTLNAICSIYFSHLMCYMIFSGMCNISCITLNMSFVVHTNHDKKLNVLSH